MNDFTSASRLVAGLGVLVVAVGLALAVAVTTAAPRSRTRASGSILVGGFVWVENFVLPSLVPVILP
jgi:hypothetical protein